MTNATNSISEDNMSVALRKTKKRNELIRQILPYTGLVLVTVLFIILTSGSILDGNNLSNLVEQCFTTTIVTVGAAFVYSCGEMDISLGGVLALSELAMGFMMNAGQPLILIILVGVAVAVGVCTFNGAVAIILKVPTFIVSLAMLSICTGIIQTVLSTQALYTPYSTYDFLNGVVLRIIALVVLCALAIFIYNRTLIGRQLKALGGNITAAKVSGISKYRKIIGFSIQGFFVGAAALFGLARSGSVLPSTGGGLGLNVVVAIVLGGFPLSGGANSKVLSVIIGALTVAILSNGLAIMGVGSELSMFVKGLLLLGVIAVSYNRSQGDLVK